MPNATRMFLLILMTTWLSGSILAQEKNLEGVQMLEHAIAASGGRQAWAGVMDFRAFGTFTVYSVGQVTDTGDAVLIGSGLKRFRLTATLQHEIRTWIWRDGAGILSNNKGMGGAIGRHNMGALEGITLPIQRVISLLDAPARSVRLVESGPSDPQGVDRVRLIKTASDRTEALSLGHTSVSTDILVNRQTFEIVAIEDTIYANDSTRDSFAHRVTYGDYRLLSGVQIPFSIQEEISGQTTWKLQIRSFEANPGIAASEFALN